MKMYRIGIALWVIAIIFAAVETHYFGYSWFPKTTGEVICDIIVLVVGFAGIALAWKSKRKGKS